mgnify:CR=1 FL=1|jgi:hypothetical protein
MIIEGSESDYHGEDDQDLNPKQFRASVVDDSFDSQAHNMDFPEGNY